MRPSDDTKILELPWILAIKIFGKQVLAIVKGCPVAADPNHLAEIGFRDLDHALEIHFLRLHNTLTRMLKCPNEPGEHRRGDLQGGRIVMRCCLPSLSDRQTRAKPIHPLR